MQNHKAPRRLKVCGNIVYYMRLFNVAKESNISAFSKDKCLPNADYDSVLSNYDRPHCNNHKAETS